MREEFGICEVLESGRVISHHVGLPRDALGHVAAAVLALVFSSKDALLGGCAPAATAFFSKCDSAGVLSTKVAMVRCRTGWHPAMVLT